MDDEPAPTHPVDHALKAHYETPAIQFEMAKACAWREVVGLHRDAEGKTYGVRPIKMFRQKDVEFWLNRLQPWTRPLDFYHSIAKVELPMLSANFKTMRIEGKKLNDDWLGLVRGWSWFADVDVFDPGTDAKPPQAYTAANFHEGRDAIIRMAEVARDMGLPAYPVFSGVGWNLRVDDYPFTGKPEDAPVGMSSLAGEVCRAAEVYYGNPKKEKNAQRRLMADNTIYDVRRINRIPFTVSTKSGLVVTPMTLGEARRCEPDWLVLDGYAKRWEVRNRLARVNQDAQKTVVA